MSNIDIYYTCPFCGSHKIRLNAAYTGGKNDCWCECGDCHAQGPHTNDKVEAMLLWNERDKQEARPYSVMGGGSFCCSLNGFMACSQEKCPLWSDKEKRCSLAILSNGLCKGKLA